MATVTKKLDRVERRLAKARQAFEAGEWFGAVKVVRSIAPGEHANAAVKRFVASLMRKIYEEAMQAWKSGDVLRARKLALLLRDLPQPYTEGAAQLITEMRRKLRSGRFAGKAKGSESAIAYDDTFGGVFSIADRDIHPLLAPTPRPPMGRRGAIVAEPSARQRSEPSAPVRSASRDVVTHRTPHMELNVPEPLAPGTQFDVTVWVDQKPARPGEESEDITIAAPERFRQFELLATLLVSEHFRVIGLAHKPLLLKRTDPSSKEISFRAAVHERSLPNTEPTLTVIFEYKGRPSGKVARHVTIRGLRVSRPARLKLAFDHEVVEPQHDLSSPALRVQHDSARADLIISVLDSGNRRDYQHYKMIVCASTLGERWEGDWPLSVRSDELVNTAMDTFMREDTSPTGRIAALRGAGKDMFLATPKEFQELFWRMVKKKKLPRTILIMTEEPFIPWELMVPTRGRSEPASDKHESFGVEFSVGRWVTDKYLSPPQKIAVTSAYVIAPHYDTDYELKNAQDEADLVCRLFKPNSRQITPATLTNIDKTLKQSGPALLHFICHGRTKMTLRAVALSSEQERKDERRFSGPQTILLDNEMDNLICTQVGSLKGFVSAFAKARTFVFLNACEVGRPVPSLVGIGGFADSFLRIHASGVVAPLWSVDDRIAHEVARQFYEAIHKSPKVPFAKVLQQIRAKAYRGEAEDTWAAYSFYGDPLATAGTA